NNESEGGRHAIAVVVPEDADGKDAGAADRAGISAGAADPVAGVVVVHVEAIIFEAHELESEAIDRQAGAKIDAADAVAGFGFAGDDIGGRLADPGAEFFAVGCQIDWAKRI